MYIANVADTNAYYYDAPWKRTARPCMRDEPSNFIVGYGLPLGQVRNYVAIGRICIASFVRG